jgi:hypothetical protein
VSKFTIADLLAKYPNDEACLAEILKRKYPDWLCSKCHRTQLYKLKNRPVYACACGLQINPLAGTIFEKTRTPLTSWFYVIYVMSQSKTPVPAASIQRQLGVKYDTAWRMMMKVRELMEDTEPLTGAIEADETYLRAKPWRTTRPLAYNGRAHTVFGVAERGGRVRAVHLPTNSTHFISKSLKEIAPEADVLYSDGAKAYVLIGREYKEHHVVQHGALEFVRDEHIYTNNIENFWGGVKRGIYGVHRVVHPEYLQAYLNQFAFIYSNRFSSLPLFYVLLDAL